MRTKNLNTVVLFMIIVLSISGCGKAKKLKRINGKGAAKAKKRLASAKVIGTITIATGVLLVSKEHLLAAFKESVKKDSIKVVVMNPSIDNVDIKVTTDGETWEPIRIKGGKKETLDSGGRGVIGINKGNKYYQVEESNLLSIVNDGQDGLEINSDL